MHSERRCFSAMLSLSFMVRCFNACVDVNIVSLRFANTSRNPIRTVVEPLLDCAIDDLREQNNRSLIRYTHTNIFQPDDRAGDCSSVADDSQYLLARWYYSQATSNRSSTNIFVWPSKYPHILSWGRDGAELVARIEISKRDAPALFTVS